MNHEELLVELAKKKAELAAKRAHLQTIKELSKVHLQTIEDMKKLRLQTTEDMKKLHLQYIEEMKNVRLKNIQELKDVRLQGILDSCKLLENELELVNTFQRILSQDRRRKAGTSRVKPLWNPATGELWYAGFLVKKFTKPAPNQRALLDWFQRFRFKNRVPNPWLEQTYITTATETLKNTVDGLNEDHITPNLLRFGWQEDGMKSYWQAIANNIVPPPPR